MFLLWRSWVAYTALIATVLGLLAGLSILQHNAILSAFTRQRLAVVVESVASSFSTVTELGTPLSMVRNADEVLGRALKLDPHIVAIQVLDSSGSVVHSTLKDAPLPVQADELQLQRLSDSGKWSLETDTQFRSSVTVLDGEGRVAGVVQAIYPKQEFSQAVRAVAWRVAGAAVALLLVFSLLAFIVLRVRLAGAIAGARMLQKWLVAARAQQPLVGAEGRLDEHFVELRECLLRADGAFAGLKQQLARWQGPASERKRMQLGSARASEVVATSIPQTSLARAFARDLMPWSIGLILLSALSLGLVTYRSVADSLEPELVRRTDLIAQVATANIQRGVSAGIPLEHMVGMDSYFNELLSNFPEITFFGVATGRFVFKAGQWQHSLLVGSTAPAELPIYPIKNGDEDIGYIIMDPSLDYVAWQFREVMLDLGVIVLIIMLLAYEVMIVVLSVSLTAPLNRLRHLLERQAQGDFSSGVRCRRGSVIEELNGYLSERVADLHRRYTHALAVAEETSNALHPVAELKALAARHGLSTGAPRIVTFSYLNDIRLPLFVFAAADELPLSFFPLFTRAADNPLTWLDPAVVISLPLAGYLLAYMLCSPFARSLSLRWGHRALLLCALVPVFLSNLAMFFATDVVEILVLRTIAGGGYALAVLACQDYVIDVVPGDQRAASLGIFSTALFGGIFAGTALGGVVADRFGTSSAFLLSALLVLIAGLMFVQMIPAGRRAAVGAEVPLTLRSIVEPLRHRHLFAIVFGLAIPQSIMDQVFISYLFSLQMDALSASAADIARMLMVYFLMIMLSGAMLGWLASWRVGNVPIVLVGSALTGGALLWAAWLPTQWSMLLAAIGTGLGHGLLRGPQVDLAMRLAETDLAHLGSSSVLGALRLFERCGSIVGLLILAAITGHFGLSVAVGTIGAMIVTGMLLYALLCLSPTTNNINTTHI